MDSASMTPEENLCEALKDFKIEKIQPEEIQRQLQIQTKEDKAQLVKQRAREEMEREYQEEQLKIYTDKMFGATEPKSKGKGKAKATAASSTVASGSSTAVPVSGKPEHTIFCCTTSELKINHRDSSWPPDEMTPLIEEFIEAINNKKVSYLNETLIAEQTLRAQTRVYKINPVIKGRETETWLFCKAHAKDPSCEFYCIMNTELIRFDRGVDNRSHLSYHCEAHKHRIFRVGYLEKVETSKGTTYSDTMLDYYMMERADRPTPQPIQ